MATRKTPAKAPAKNEKANETGTSGLVRPLPKEALQLTLGIINNAQIAGKDAELVAKLKLELLRVAGVAGA